MVPVGCKVARFVKYKNILFFFADSNLPLPINHIISSGTLKAVAHNLTSDPKGWPPPLYPIASPTIKFTARRRRSCLVYYVILYHSRVCIYKHFI